MTFFKTPSNLLEFASDIISRIDSYRRIEKDYSDDIDSFLEVLMINEIVQPWLKNEENVKERIAKGLKTIYEQYGDDYFKEVQLIEKTIDIGTSGTINGYDFYKTTVLSIQTLYKISDIFQAYEESQKKLS